MNNKRKGNVQYYRSGILVLLILFSLVVSSVDASWIYTPDFYYSYDELCDVLEEFQVNYPTLFMYDSLGKTAQGRHIWYAKISDNVTSEELEPEILFSGGIHGIERPGFQVVITTMKSILENYTQPHINESFTARIQTIVNTTELYFLPMVNPDGVEAETRKNRRPNSCLFGNRAFAGVDINRNFAYQWDDFDRHPFKYLFGHIHWNEFLRHPLRYFLDNFPEILERPTVKYPFLDFQGLIPFRRGGHYRGPYPFSENESQAMKSLIETHEFLICIDYHTAGEKILYPWDWTRDPPPDRELFVEIADNISSFNGYEVNQGSHWYYIPGCSNDWMYAEHHVLSFIIELCSLQHPFQSYDQEFVEDLCYTHLLVNLYAAEKAQELY